MSGQFGSIQGDVSGRSFPLDARIFVFGCNKYCDAVVQSARSHEAKIVIDKENKVWLSRFGQDGDVPLLDECSFKIGSEKFTYRAPRLSKTPAHGHTPIFTGDTPLNVLFEETEVPTQGHGDCDFDGPDTIDVRKALSFEPTGTIGFNLLDEVTLGLGLPSPTLPRCLQRRRTSRGFPRVSSAGDHALSDEPTTTKVTFAFDRLPFHDVSNQRRQEAGLNTNADQSQKVLPAVAAKKSDRSSLLGSLPAGPVAAPPASPLQAARDARKLAAPRDHSALGRKMAQIQDTFEQLPPPAPRPLDQPPPRTYSAHASIARLPQTAQVQCFFHPSCQAPAPAPAPDATTPAAAPAEEPQAVQAYAAASAPCAEKEREPAAPPPPPAASAGPQPPLATVAPSAVKHGDGPPPAKKAAPRRVIPPPPPGRPKALSAPTAPTAPPALGQAAGPRPSSVLVPAAQKPAAKRGRAEEEPEASKRRCTGRMPPPVAREEAASQRSRSQRVLDRQRAPAGRAVAPAVVAKPTRPAAPRPAASKGPTSSKAKAEKRTAKEVATARPATAKPLPPQPPASRKGRLATPRPSSPPAPQATVAAADRKRSRSTAAPEDPQKRPRLAPGVRAEVTALLHTNKLSALRRPELVALHARLGLTAKSNHTKTQLIRDMALRLQA